MGIEVFAPSQEFMQGAVSQAHDRATKRARGGSKYWFDLKENAATYFYLLPPWSKRGDLGRVVWNEFISEKEIHTCWKTYDYFRPGFGDSCPVCEALKSCSKQLGDRVKRMRSKPKGHVNALIVGIRKLDPSGQPTGTMEPFDTVAVRMPRMLRLPVSVYDELIALQTSPDIGYICMPDSGVMAYVIRSGSGIDTSYTLKLCGNDTGEKFTPHKAPMFTSKEEQDACLGALVDLEAEWPMIDEAGMAASHKLANEIKAQVNLGGAPVFYPGAAVGPYVPTGATPATNYAPPYGTGVNYAPASHPSPAPPPSYTAPPVAPTAPPSAAPAGPPWATAAPAAPAPAVAQTAAAPAAPVSNAVDPVLVTSMLTESMGPTPPRNPNNPMRPACFGLKKEIPNGPNKAWCESCPYAVPCTVQSRGM